MEEKEMIILSNNLITVEQKEEIQNVINKLNALDNELRQFKILEEKYNTFKSILYEKMNDYGIDKYVSTNGTQFTRVSPSSDKTEMILKFNENKLKVENPDIYKKYLEPTEKITKGRTGYLRITLPRLEEDNDAITGE